LVDGPQPDLPKGKLYWVHHDDDRTRKRKEKKRKQEKTAVKGNEET